MAADLGAEDMGLAVPRGHARSPHAGNFQAAHESCNIPLNRRGFVEQGPLFDRAVAWYRARAMQSPIATIVLVAVERMLPVLSPAYGTGLSEEQGRAMGEP